MERVALSLVDYGQRLVNEMPRGTVAQSVSMRSTLSGAQVEFLALHALLDILGRRHSLYTPLLRRVRRRLLHGVLSSLNASLQPVIDDAHRSLLPTLLDPTTTASH